MAEEIERDLGEQPIAAVMATHGFKAHDVVAAWPEGQLTHKMIARAWKGRRLTANTQDKVQRALNLAAGREYALGELFNYR